MAFKGLPQAIAPASSGSAFLGEDIPYVAAVMEDLANNVQEYVAVAIEEALPYLQDELRQAVSAYPEWGPYADQVSVEWDGTGFQYYYTGTEEEIATMRNLEYGFDVDSSPQTVVRKTAIGTEHELGKIMTDALDGVLRLG